MRFKIPIAALLLTVPAVAEARDWRYLTTVDTRGVVFIDIDSIQREPNMFPIGRVLMVQPESAGPNAALEMVVTIDCVAHKQRVLEMTGYDADGKVVMSQGSSVRWDLTASQMMADIEFAICGSRRIPSGASFGGGVPIAEGRAILVDGQP